MGARAFRWFPHDGLRHAIRDELVACDEGETLCGLRVTVPHDPQPKIPDWCWPTCTGCDRCWRAHEGIPVFPYQQTPPVTRDRGRVASGATGGRR